MVGLWVLGYKNDDANEVLLVKPDGQASLIAIARLEDDIPHTGALEEWPGVAFDTKAKRIIKKKFGVPEFFAKFEDGNKEETTIVFRWDNEIKMSDLEEFDFVGDDDEPDAVDDVGRISSNASPKRDAVDDVVRNPSGASPKQDAAD